MIIPLWSGIESGTKPVALRLNRVDCVNRLRTGNPLAGQGARRISGLDPDAGKLCTIARGKIEDDFGHDVLLPAHFSRSRQADLEHRSSPGAWWPDIVLGGVGRAAGSSWVPDGFCSLARTGLCTVRSERMSI